VTCLKKIISPPKSCLLFEIIFENCYKIADIEIFLETGCSLVYLIALCKDQGRSSNHLEAAVAKLFVGDWSLEPFNGAYLSSADTVIARNTTWSASSEIIALGPIGGGTSDIQKDYFPAYVRI
jgi:butyryl-CoA dehydrogenase